MVEKRAIHAEKTVKALLREVDAKEGKNGLFKKLIVNL